MKTFLCWRPRHAALIFLVVFSCLPAIGQEAAERPAIYPFDVKVGGALAVIDGSPEAAIFARAPVAVKNDATVEVVAEPGMLIVNVFPCEGDGKLDSAAQGKVIMATAATKVQLNQTMDKSVLAPGFYLMNVVMAGSGTSRVVFEIGDGAAAEPAPGAEPAPAAAPANAAAGGGAGIDQSRPESVLQAIFDCAASGKLAALKGLQSSTADGDVKSICMIGDAPVDGRGGQADFVKQFATGKIAGSARIEGDTAALDFMFGRDGKKNETMNLVRENGRWFLDGF